MSEDKHDWRQTCLRTNMSCLAFQIDTAHDVFGQHDNEDGVVPSTVTLVMSFTVLQAH